MAMDFNDLFVPLRDKLKAKIIQKFNLQPGGYDDAYLTNAMSAFAEAIAEEVIPFIQNNADVNPIKASPSNRLYVEVPASGGGMTVINVQGTGKVD